MVPCSTYLDRDLQALRLTCREMYEKTAYDAAVRYRDTLKEPHVWLTYESLALLLHISKIPAFRDSVEKINLYFPAELDRESEDRGHEYGESEAVYLLAECLCEFSTASFLKAISVHNPQAYATVLTAFDLAQFPQSMVAVMIDPIQIRSEDFQPFYGILARSSAYVKEVEIESSYTSCSKEVRAEDMLENSECRHYQRFVGYYPWLEQLLANLRDVESILFNGCSYGWLLRQCNACGHLLTYILPYRYPNLTSLRLDNIYISGSRLRGFIKRHAPTLQNAALLSVYLTDSTWRSIVQGLRKYLNLTYLDMHHLLQKRAASPLSQKLSQKYARNEFGDCRLRVRT
jgi:hypothetical protein